MSFNNLTPANGPFFLARGASMRIWVKFGNGDDHGAQSIMAHPIADGNSPTELVVSDLSKVLGYNIGQITENGAPHYHYEDPFYYYQVTVTNRGGDSFFSVQGGGNT